MSLRSPLSSFAAPALVAAALVAGLASSAEAQVVKGRLIQCASTTWTATPCGGDPITDGWMTVNGGPNYPIIANVTGLNVFNMYEVYWLPIGQSVGSAIYIGAFGTDASGNANTALQNGPTTPAALVGGGADSNFVTQVGVAQSAGNFLIYSRGPWGYNDADHNNIPDTLNTTPYGGRMTDPLANPTITLTTDNVQFIPGFR